MERLMNVLSSQQKRQKRGIIAMALMLFVFFIIFYLNSNKSEDVVFAFILGDNLFYGTGLGRSLKESLGNLGNSSRQHSGSTIFTYSVSDPTQYGVVSFDSSGKIEYLEEKPKNPRSNFAVTGLYVFDSRAVGFAKELKLSSRGELEIIDVLKKYHEIRELKVMALGRGTAWLDTGTFNNLYEASTFIKILQDRQGVKIGDPHEAATVQGWVES